MAAVGNEVMYRGDLTEDELLAFMAEVGLVCPTMFPWAMSTPTTSSRIVRRLPTPATYC